MVVPDFLINLSYDKINSKIAHSLDTLSGERAFFLFRFILFCFCFALETLFKLKYLQIAYER